MATGYDFSRLKILVADDNKFMRETVRLMLDAFGVKHIAMSGSAEDAWRRFPEFNPDLCLIDWRMEGGDGIDFVKRVRLDPASHNRFVPIIMLTGNAEARHVVVARDIGVNLYLAKPISAEALYNRLVAAVETNRPFVKTETYFGPDRRGRPRADYKGPKRRESDLEAT